MKRIPLIILSAIVPTLITSCDSVDAKHAITAMLNYDSIAFNQTEETIFDIDAYKIYDLLNYKSSFVLEITQDGCTHCETFSPHLNKYIENTHIQFYRYNMKKYGDYVFFQDVVLQEYEEQFISFTGTPYLSIYNEGKNVYNFPSESLTSYKRFASLANKHFYRSSLYTVSTLNGLVEFLNNFKNTLIYYYDDTSLISNDLYVTITKHVNKSSKNILILCKNQLIDQELSLICNYFSFEKEAFFAVEINGKTQNKTADYLQGDGQLFKQYLLSYLG